MGCVFRSVSGVWRDSDKNDLVSSEMERCGMVRLMKCLKRAEQ